MKQYEKVRIGLYSAGLRAYWAQFEGLKERLDGYNAFLSRRLSELGDVYNFGFVDTEEAGAAAGNFFRENGVDLIFAHSATYFTSSCVLPVHQEYGAPVIFLNLQPTAEMNYAASGTGEWLAHCVACPIPEVSNAFERAGLTVYFINGLLGQEQAPAISLADENTAARPEALNAWREIREWVLAAKIRKNLAGSRFGFLGGYYSGMLDMYSDFTLLQSKTGIHIEILEMCDIAKALENITDAETAEMLEKINAFFEISGDSPSDPIARRPEEAQLRWSAKVACAQRRLTEQYRLDALSYYYHGQDGGYYEEIQSGFIVGNSLLTAEGIPCAGEGDIKTNLAMKISDIIGCGGSFSEIVAADFNRNTMIIGHDGPFHVAIARRKPILRGMGVYHGKKGSGVSVEAKVRTGPVTTLGAAQTRTGLKFIISEGEAMDYPVLLNGNTMTHIRFGKAPSEYMDQWFLEAPTHHCAVSVGHNAPVFAKAARLMGIPFAIV